jgi:hypothetical protein
MGKNMQPVYLIAAVLFGAFGGSLFAHSTTHFFALTDQAFEEILRDSKNKTEITKQTLKEYFEKQGVVFSEHANLDFDGEQIILQESEANTNKIEAICKQIGIKPYVPVDEWSPFIRAEFSRQSNSTLEVTLFYEKGSEGLPVPLVLLKSSFYQEGNILYRGEHLVGVVRADPFNQEETAEYGIRFVVDQGYLDRVYIGGILRPQHQIKSLEELAENSLNSTNINKP